MPPARWVRPTGLHLTLAFLGEVEAERVAAIAQALREKLEQEGGFRAHFAGLGSFPNAGPVRVVWAGLEPAARFSRLAELAQDALRAAGVAFDDRPFRSHVTLARCDPPWPAHLRAEIGELAEGFGDETRRGLLRLRPADALLERAREGGPDPSRRGRDRPAFSLNGSSTFFCRSHPDGRRALRRSGLP